MRIEGALGEPHQGRGDVARGDRRVARGREHLAAADVDLVAEAQGDAERRGRVRDRAFERVDRGHAGRAARGEHHDLVARAHDAAGDEAGEAAVVEVGADHRLDGKAERLVGSRASNRERLEQAEQRRPAVPGGAVAGRDHVVPALRGHRDERDAVEVELGGEGGELALELVEARLCEVDEVHLVHGDDQLRDAEQRRDRRVPARLREHAEARVEQDDGDVGGRGAGRHVARVLLVPRGVGDDELSRLGREVAVGDVDRDALLALGEQPVGEQREVDLLFDAAHARLAHGAELVVEHRTGVVQQAADERRLAVIDAADGREAHQLLLLVAGEEPLDVCERTGAQKYPSRFFVSIEPSSSWSMRRPWRSLLLESSISRMTSGSVVAVLSTAPESG